MAQGAVGCKRPGLGRAACLERGYCHGRAHRRVQPSRCRGLRFGTDASVFFDLRSPYQFLGSRRSI